jgi:hypothetical protein
MLTNDLFELLGQTQLGAIVVAGDIQTKMLQRSRQLHPLDSRQIGRN